MGKALRSTVVRFEERLRELAKKSVWCKKDMQGVAIAVEEAKQRGNEMMEDPVQITHIHDIVVSKGWM